MWGLYFNVAVSYNNETCYTWLVPFPLHQMALSASDVVAGASWYHCTRFCVWCHHLPSIIVSNTETCVTIALVAYLCDTPVGCVLWCPIIALEHHYNHSKPHFVERLPPLQMCNKIRMTNRSTDNFVMYLLPLSRYTEHIWEPDWMSYIGSQDISTPTAVD